MKKLLISLIFSLLFAPVLEAASPSRQLRQALSPYIEQGEIAGIVTVIAKGDDLLSVESFGYADIENKRKMTPQSLFWIASQSKPIAGAALMMLVDEGRVDLDAPITDYLPELAELKVECMNRGGVTVLAEPANVPTLRQFMTHTAGMRWVAYPQEKSGKIDILPLGLSLYTSAATPLLADPGERYSYSNQGINIGATVIERVAGMPYEDFLQQRLFDPLGMKSATFWPSPEKIAVGYRKGAGGSLEPVEIDQLQYPLDDRAKRFPEAAGGLFCAPEDLVKFYQMVANKGEYKGKRLLSEEAVEVMTTKQTGDKIPDPYGLGWVAPDNTAGHAGAYGTNSIIHKEDGYVLMYFVLSQGLPKEGEALARFQSTARAFYGIE